MDLFYPHVNSLGRAPLYVHFRGEKTGPEKSNSLTEVMQVRRQSLDLRPSGMTLEPTLLSAIQAVTCCDPWAGVV